MKDTHDFYMMNIVPRFERNGFIFNEESGEGRIDRWLKALTKYAWDFGIRRGYIQEYMLQRDIIKYSISTAKIIEVVQEQMDECYRNYGRVTRIIVGQQGFNQIRAESRSGDVEIIGPVKINVCYKYQGFEVEIIPWFDGIVVLPD